VHRTRLCCTPAHSAPSRRPTRTLAGPARAADTLVAGGVGQPRIPAGAASAAGALTSLSFSFPLVLVLAITCTPHARPLHPTALAYFAFILLRLRPIFLDDVHRIREFESIYSAVSISCTQ